jgi:two-component system LytT family response regulator
MNCIIVDDDKISRLDLGNKVKQIPFLNLIDSCSSAEEATTCMMRQQVDLMILDVLMPGMNGLELMKALQAEKPQVILVSSSKEFAPEAFDLDVTDFLVKPVSNERFLRSIAKAKRFYNEKVGVSLPDENFVFVKVNSRLVKIDVRDILFVEALADYVTVNTINNKYTIHSTMKGMEITLPERHFFRVHNSYILRLDKIAEIEDNYVAIGQKLIPVSRSRVRGLMQKLKILT